MHQPAPRPRALPRRRWRAALALGGLLLAVALPGCGGGSTGPSPIVQPPAPTPDPPSPPPVPPPTLRITKILAFGDSLTAGTTSPPVAAALTAGPPQSYPFKLQDLLGARYSAQTVTVSNAGRPGEFVATSAALKRFGEALSEAKPDLVLLLEGANDLNNAGDMVNATITASVSSLEEMVKESVRRNMPIMVATLPPQRPPKGAAAASVQRFNDAVKVMAGKKGAMLVDVNAQMPEALIGQDGLHPTEAGYQRLAEIFGAAIRAQYEAPAPAVQ